MPEKEESFLEILNNYFSNLKESEIIDGTPERITIPIEWLYTSEIDRDTIEQAFISLFCKANGQFRDRIRKDKERYGKIDSLEIEKTDAGVNLVAKARDGGTKTKVLVTSDKNLKGPFYAISEEGLYDAVLNSYNFQNSIEIAKKFNLSPEERKKLLIDELSKPEIVEHRRDSIKTGMLDAAKNLTKYYDYMSKKMIKYEAKTGTIHQRKDEGPNKNRRDFGRDATRKSEIYDFQERESVLIEMNPIQIVNIDSIEEDNSLNRFAYTTYIYENLRGKQGYLVIAEPFEGNHCTRARFIPQEEYDILQVGQDEDKFVHISEELTEMSNGECSESRFTKIFNHTSIEKFREKFRRIVLGEEVENPIEKIRYQEIDDILFEGKRRITEQGIRAQIKGVKINDMPSARAALYSDLEQEKTDEQDKT